MNEDNNLTPQQPQQPQPPTAPQPQNINPQPDPNSLATQINQQYQNGQPQQFAQPQFQAQYPPNGQMYGAKPKSNTWAIVLAIVLFLAIGGGALYQFVLSGDDEPAKKSAVSVDEDETSSKDTEETDDSDEASPVSTAQAQSNDIQRTADLNAIYSKLEEYFNEYGGYPAEPLTAESLFRIEEESLIDVSGNPIVQLENSTDTVVPQNPYKAGVQPEQGEYTYAPYQCAEDSFGLLCDKYMLYGWYETKDNFYVRQSLN